MATIEEKPKLNLDENFDIPVVKPTKIGTGKKISAAFLLVVFFTMWFFYNELYVAEAQNVPEVNFTVTKGESIGELAKRLKQEKIIRNTWLFKKYLVLRGIDKKVQAGDFQVIYPVTLSRVATALKTAVYQGEKKITVLPGWDLRDLAAYLQEREIIDDKDELFDLVGKSAVMYAREKAPVLDYDFKLLQVKPENVSYEGYLAPDTYRVFLDADVTDVVRKLAAQQNKLFTEKMYEDITESGRTVHEILTMASIVEREVRSTSDKAKVADIFWRRYDSRWPLQADSTVHYAVNKSGDVFTTKEDRETDNLWNTYKHVGLPPGPIAAPDLDSIKAAIYPETNEYWYFLTDFDGEVRYGKDLDEHNRNVQKYLR